MLSNEHTHKELMRALNVSVRNRDMCIKNKIMPSSPQKYKNNKFIF
jgi:hypothetical protein